MEPQVTPEQLKTLKLFSIYCQSYGAETASKDYYIEYCNLEWTEEWWSSPETNIHIESYSKIEEVLNEIIETNDLIEQSTTDCDNRSQLTVHIDCVNRILTITSLEWQFSYDDSSDSKSSDEIKEEYGDDVYNEVMEIFERLGENSDAEAIFSGGGDDGAIDDNIDINGTSEPISDIMMNMFYTWLSNTYGGWENNEGGQGRFYFNPSTDEIILEMSQNSEEGVDTSLNFKINF